jgi:hypothetical protein
VSDRPVVLALEFHAVRKTADFGFLREPEHADRLLRLDPLDDHVAEGLSVERHSRLLLSRSDVPPSLVLAYCGTAALAAHTAARCGAALVLVDPDVVDSEIMHRDFLQLCATMNVDPTTVDATGRLAQWEAVLTAARDRVATEYGGDEEAYEMVDDLFARYRAWAWFLEAARDPVPAAPDGEITVISGRPPRHLGALLARPERATFHQATPDADTLSLPDVQDLVRRLFHHAIGAIR